MHACVQLNPNTCFLGVIEAKADRHPMSRTPVDTMLTMMKGVGGM